MHRSIAPLKGVALAAIVAITAAACAAGLQAGAGNASDGSPTIGFASPGDGAEVTIPFAVELEANVPLGEPETGNHHAHLYFDTSTNSADYDIVYGTSWEVTRPLGPGEHTITVALANPDHSLAGPTQAITVTVGPEGSAGPEGPDTGPSLDPTAPAGPIY